jgi:flagellar biosynthesis regulator FlbT
MALITTMKEMKSVMKISLKGEDIFICLLSTNKLMIKADKKIAIEINTSEGLWKESELRKELTDQ